MWRRYSGVRIPSLALNFSRCLTRVKASTTSKPQLQRLEALRSLLSGVMAAFRKPADHQGLGAAKSSCIGWQIASTSNAEDTPTAEQLN
ncbi:Hypothetical protein P9303_19911 [Prochlorococcus marinus str. MIT 9303]|uniref:Uncharacterized protein n=1 Tax=Prochlorococcus marinus (strain MIT 9303) TaxID=59922 RepID=A2CB73_PROM3|nr:Hypothetical protein P9303_19911 [Prochlorococcus marinus str. MIT 9303]